MEKKGLKWIGVEMLGDAGRPPKKNVITHNKPRRCPSPDDRVNISDATASQQAAQAKHGFQGPEKNSNVVIERMAIILRNLWRWCFKVRKFWLKSE